MKKICTLAVAAGMLSALYANSVYACGESLFRVGKGVTFREYTAPLPGSIVVIASSEGELAMAERFAAAGHDIHVLSDPSELREELATHEIDMVVAYFRDRDVIRAQIGDVASVDYLPVAMKGTSESEEIGQQYSRWVSSDDSVLTFLKAIHKTLEQQG